MEKIVKIVLTGGPCAGKTSAMSLVKSHFTKKGYTVLVMPETATELINSGITPTTCKSHVDFQRVLMMLQQTKEQVYVQAAMGMNAKKILILCDRGQMDNKSYLTDEQFDALLHIFNFSEPELFNQYGAVFHLNTAAKGALEYYNTQNNSARTETPEEAIALDDRLIEAWKAHNYYRIIDNSTGFEEKLNRLIREIEGYLDTIE